jgi:hypothetical protein
MRSLTTTSGWPRATGGAIDLERFREELPLVVDVVNPHVRQGVEDALAGRPSRW